MTDNPLRGEDAFHFEWTFKRDAQMMTDPNVCCYCEKPILTMAYQGTAVCSVLCEKAVTVYGFDREQTLKELTQWPNNFENAAFADVVKKANQAAAQKGVAFEMAAGIVLQNEANAGFRVRATDLEIYYTEWIEPLVDCDEVFMWRVSSRLLTAVTNVLPIGSNRSVTLTVSDGEGVMSLESGSIRCKLPLIDTGGYPNWTIFSPDEVQSCVGFADKLVLVEWAVARDGNVPLNGIHFGDDFVAATNRYKLGKMPLTTTLNHSFTVPASNLSSLVRANGGGDAKIGFADGKLLIMPSDHCQLQLITYDVGYPKLDPIFAKVGNDSFRIGKQNLLDLITRTEGLSSVDRIPRVHVWLGKNQIAAQSLLEHHNGASIGDSITCYGIDHPRIKFMFDPANLIGGIQNAPGSEIEVSYNKDDAGAPWGIASDGGYLALVMPSQRVKNQEA